MTWLVDKLLAPIVTGLSVAGFGLLLLPLIENQLEDPSCDNPRSLVQLQSEEVEAVEGRAKPDESFPQTGRVSYRPANILDGNTSTAWVEGSPGLGIGAEIEIMFRKSHDVALVCVVDGYAKSWDLYQRNSRVRVLETTTDQGRRLSLLADGGSPEHPAIYQQVNITSGATSRIQFTVESAYAAQVTAPGAQTYADTAISEVEIWVSP